MGQCLICHGEAQYNFIDQQFINTIQKLKINPLGKEIQTFKLDNQQYLKPFKLVTMPGGLYYRGKIDQIKKQGFGQLYCDLFYYYGFFKNDLPHGKGALVTNQQCLFGQFYEGVINGKGKEWIASQNKIQFQGTFLHGKRVYGVLTKQEFVYQGSLVNDLFQGRGKLTLENGTVYDGYFKEGKFDGKGKLQFFNKNKYIGSFKEGQFSGYGQYDWKNGNNYKGYYLNGKKHGYGMLRIQGTEYAGQWKNGFRQGRGFLAKGGDNAFGDWKQNNLIEDEKYYQSTQTKQLRSD